MIIQGVDYCDVCKCEIIMFPEYGRPNSPMVQDCIWKRLTKWFGIKEYQKDEIIYTGEGIFLCDTCMEKGLGRRLRKTDLNMCPLTTDWIRENRDPNFDLHKNVTRDILRVYSVNKAKV